MERFLSPKVLIPALLGIFLLTVGGSYYYFYVYQKPSEPEPTNGTSECEKVGTKEGWCLFESSEFSFSIEYPEGWEIHEQESFGDTAFWFISSVGEEVKIGERLYQDRITRSVSIDGTSYYALPPVFEVYPTGFFGGEFPSSSKLDQKDPTTLNGTSYEIRRYSGGESVYVLPSEVPTPPQSFEIQFFGNRKDAQTYEIFDEIFETLKFLE